VHPTNQFVPTGSSAATSSNLWFGRLLGGQKSRIVGVKNDLPFHARFCKQIEGKWKQSMGKLVKERWPMLTDDDIIAINDNREQLVGKIQERYGITKDSD
jgi:uncharacterized protein YjbJ (UPF0337 family)